jgi:hypothetical protein
VKPFERTPELTDAQIEAIVAEAIAAEASLARREAAPPSSAIVWWRAQMRARQEAAKAAERPLTIVHGLAIACGLGLLLAVVGALTGGVAGSLAWVTGIYQSLSAWPSGTPEATSGWLTLPPLPMLASMAMIVTAVVASIAVYVIFADE